MESGKHVILFTLIHACFGAVVRNNDTEISLPASLPLNAGVGRQQREQRSGGFPKFPANTIETHMSRDTHYLASECGTRVIHFDPINELLRKGKIVGGTTVSLFYLILFFGFFYKIIK